MQKDIHKDMITLQQRSVPAIPTPTHPTLISLPYYFSAAST
jgi:hypothetical protein